MVALAATSAAVTVAVPMPRCSGVAFGVSTKPAGAACSTAVAAAGIDRHAMVAAMVAAVIVRRIRLFSLLR
ncbi:hypothetical protein AVR91_0208735 [Amycolatopsis keratiniphila subsp. keratiniphila]|uniref:Uncharacterized protein n=1 Tax=Amycolatopsis keratiniphila subsp. keratiniphila TaxID=227715 RepID=A0A1W2LZA8_9PSEU|nr:hypothetical protein AVR91_0208735 [Amycolatopsis keratiniphila subsp. keratiniphila]